MFSTLASPSFSVFLTLEINYSLEKRHALKDIQISKSLKFFQSSSCRNMGSETTIFLYFTFRTVKFMYFSGYLVDFLLTGKRDKIVVFPLGIYILFRICVEFRFTSRHAEIICLSLILTLEFCCSFIDFHFANYIYYSC